LSAFALLVHTDGACSGNPGPGGYGCWWEDTIGKVERFGGETRTTNNRMELMAVVDALRSLGASTHSRSTPIVIRSDSQYVVKGMNEWITGWRRRNWVSVKNRDLWEALSNAQEGLVVSYVWVRGHCGDMGNEHADVLARRGLALSRQKGCAVSTEQRSQITLPATHPSRLGQ
jgi:ribonuclease HI